MIRNRRTHIVATLGPVSRSPEMVLQLARAGADVFRLNFSHARQEDHALAAKAVREAEDAIGRPLALLADLQGPKFRLGLFKGGQVEVTPGQSFRLDLDTTPGDRVRAPFPHPEVMAALQPGHDLVLDDGRVRLRVTGSGRDFVETTVVSGAQLSDRKGVALPGLTLPMPALTAKDRDDLAFALELGVDWVALSFVQRAADMAQLRALVGDRAWLMAKIEKPAALEALEEIFDHCDGVMVARGDLGVEMAPQDVPVAQKAIGRAARRRGAVVVIATQMLESMTSSPTATRAEASDVAGGVYEGADALMLSGETASGQYPVEAVTLMDAVIRRVEGDPVWPNLMRAERDDDVASDVDALIVAAVRAADSPQTSCLVAFTTLGGTARRLSRERPTDPVLALTPSLAVARRLGLYWGLETRVAPQPRGVTSMTIEAAQLASDLGLAPPDARVLIVAGTPFGAPGAANLLRFAAAPRAKGNLSS